MTTYTAVFERDATGWLYISVPELSGYHTQAKPVSASAKPWPSGSTPPKTR